MTDPATATPRARQQRNHEATVSAILQAAREVMRENGVGDLNLQEVARRVGMRAPSLYNYFSSRTAIYEALFARNMRAYCDELEHLFVQYGATWEGLERSIESYLSFALENPELYQLMFERPVPGFVPSPEGLEQARRLIGIGQRLTAEAIAAGTFHPQVSPEAASNLLIALMHGITAQHLANEPHLPLGQGRFGSLVPFIIDLLKQAWSPVSRPE